MESSNTCPKFEKDEEKTSFIDEDDDFRTNSLVGTEEYVAPEMLLGHESTYGLDLWSLGVILYQCFTGRTPFKGST